MSKKEDALRQECRKADPDGVEIDCYVISGEEAQKRAENRNFWDTLTEGDKNDIIEVNGRQYIRKVYERNH